MSSSQSLTIWLPLCVNLNPSVTCSFPQACSVFSWKGLENFGKLRMKRFISISVIIYLPVLTRVPLFLHGICITPANIRAAAGNHPGNGVRSETNRQKKPEKAEPIVPMWLDFTLLRTLLQFVDSELIVSGEEDPGMLHHGIHCCEPSRGEKSFLLSAMKRRFWKRR